MRTIAGWMWFFPGWCGPVRLEAGGIVSEVLVMRAMIVVRRFVALIVLGVAVVAAALAVAGAATAHHSLADNGVINSKN